MTTERKMLAIGEGTQTEPVTAEMLEAGAADLKERMEPTAVAPEPVVLTMDSLCECNDKFRHHRAWGCGGWANGGPCKCKGFKPKAVAA